MNEIEHIIRMLASAGLNVLGADDEFLYLEDPSCPVRAFQTFAEYAWIILCVLTGLLLMAWGIAKIRAVKSDLKNNFKNLFLICGIVSVTVPILNFIYGGDLIGAACKKVKVPISEVNSILAARVESGEKEFMLYEDIDIHDSGPKESKDEQPDAVKASKIVDELERISDELDVELTIQEQNENSGENLDQDVVPSMDTEQSQEQL